MLLKIAKEIRNYLKTAVAVNVPGIGVLDTWKDDANDDEAVKKFINYYGLDPNKIFAFKGKKDIQSFFAPARSIVAENDDEKALLDRLAGGGAALVPGIHDPAITAHELGHASSPLLMSENPIIQKVMDYSMPLAAIAIPGLALGGINHAQTELMDLIGEKYLNSKGINVYNPKTFINPKLKAGLAAVGAAAYAPLFAEETLTNIRATKALWDTSKSISEFLGNMPSIGMSELSYALPMIAAAGMIAPAFSKKYTPTTMDKIKDMGRIFSKNITSPSQMLSSALMQRNLWHV
jgi:hypothetical protein